MLINPKPLLVAAFSLPFLAGFAKAEEVIQVCNSPEATTVAFSAITQYQVEDLWTQGCLPFESMPVARLESLGYTLEYWGRLEWNGRITWRRATVSDGKDQFYIITRAEERRS